MFVLDTNSFIYFFKGQGRVPERLLATAPSEIAMPAIVLHELEYGIATRSQSPQRRAQLNAILTIVRVIPFDSRAARAAAEIRADLRARGKPIGPFDMLIAGTALSRGAIVVTRNVNEFERVRGLRVENWF